MGRQFLAPFGDLEVPEGVEKNGGTIGGKVSFRTSSTGTIKPVHSLEPFDVSVQDPTTDEGNPGFTLDGWKSLPLIPGQITGTGSRLPRSSEINHQTP